MSLHRLALGHYRAGPSVAASIDRLVIDALPDTPRAGWAVEKRLPPTRAKFGPHGLRLMLFHIGAEQDVDSSLVAAPLFFEPF